MRKRRREYRIRYEHSYDGEHWSEVARPVECGTDIGVQRAVTELRSSLMPLYRHIVVEKRTIITSDWEQMV